MLNRLGTCRLQINQIKKKCNGCQAKTKTRPSRRKAHKPNVNKRNQGIDAASFCYTLNQSTDLRSFSEEVSYTAL